MANDGWEDISANDGWEDVAPSKTTFTEDIKAGFGQIGNMVDKGWTLSAATLANLAGHGEDTDEMFRNMEQRNKSRDEWVDIGGKEQGLGGKATSMISTLPMQVVAAPLSAIDTAMEFINNGESIENAYKAAGVDAAFTAAGFLIPAGMGKTLLQKAITGGGANAILEPLSKLAIQSQAEQAVTQKQFAPSVDDAVLGAILGAGMGASTHRRAAPHADTANKIAPKVEPSMPAEHTSMDPALRDAETVNTRMEVERLQQELAAKEPALREAQLAEQQRLFEQAQAEQRGILSDAARMDDAASGQMDLLKSDGNAVPYKMELAEPPVSDGGVRHLDPDTGKVVQGMDASVPTVDFPLKTEMLDADPRINAMREFIAKQEQFNEQVKGARSEADMAQLQGTVDELKGQFGEYLDKGYGVTKPADAYPKLIETGQGTKLPIKRGFNPRGKQGGAIHPSLLTYGVSNLIDVARRSYPADSGMRVLSKFVGTFNKKAIREAINKSVDPKSRESLHWMTPQEFLKAAKERMLDNFAMREEKRSGIRSGLKGEKGLDGIPTLLIENGKVVGHEGRHRMDVFTENGLDRIPVRIVDGLHRNEKGPLPYKSLVSENGEVIPVPQKIEGLNRVPEASMRGPKSHQGGAIDHQAIKEGLGVAGNKLAELFSKSKKKPATAPMVHNPTLKALADSAAGKGLADFTDLLKTPEEIIQMSREADDIKRAPIQENIENGGLFRGLATRHPVVKYTSERLTQAAKNSHRWIRDNLTDTETGLKGFMRDLDPTAKGEIWQAMMMNEGQKVLSTDELKARGFSDKQIKFYEKFRQIDEAFYDEFNKQRAELGLAPMDKRTAHVAGRFLGDFYQMAYRAKLDKNGHPVFDENGSVVREVVGRIPGTTKWGVEKAVKFMKEQHPDWEFGNVEYKKIGKGNAAGDRFAGFMEVLNMLGKDNPHTKALVDSYKDFMKSDAQNYLDAQRHAKDKKAQAGGIVGSEGNKPWLDAVKNAEEGMKAQLAYLEQGHQWLEMQKANTDISKVLGDEHIATNMPNAVAWANKQKDHAFGRNQGVVSDAANAILSEVGKATGLGHSNLLKGSNRVKHLMMQKFMGFLNIPFTISQLAQPLQTLPPMMALMKLRGVDAVMSKAAADGTWTTMKLFYGNTPLANKWDTSFNKFEEAALKYAHENGVFDVQMVDHTKDINSSALMEGIDAVADFNIKYPEMATRGTAFMTFAHALKESGMPLDQVFSTAENMTRMTMADYTPQARPKMYDQMGWLGDLASTLARYKHNQVNQLTFYGREAREGIKRGQPQFAIPLLTHIGTSLAFGGAMGLIGYNVADEVYRMFSEHVLKKPDSLTDLIMRTGEIPQAISHGLFSLAGVDMSSRFSNAQVIPENFGQFLLPYGTGLADAVGSTYDFVKQPNEWNAKRAATALAPSSMTGLLENQFFTEDNADGTKAFINRRTGERNYNRSPEEAKMRNFGFRSMKESTERNVNYEFKQREEAEKRIRTNLMDKAFTEYLSGNLDRDTMGEYARKYLEAGSDQFDRDFQQRLLAYKLTERERIIKRNAGGNYSGARNLQELMREGYNKQ